MTERLPRLGEIVHFIPRDPRAGQAEIAAMVTRVWPDGLLDLDVFPAMSEKLQLKRAMRRSEIVTKQCWEFAPDDHALVQEVVDLRNELDELRALVEDKLTAPNGDAAKRAGRPPMPRDAQGNIIRETAL